MAQKTPSRFFSVMVIGDDPETIMSKYDMSKKVKPYAKYKYLNAKKIQESTLKILSNLLEDPKKIGLNEFHIDYLRDRYKSIKALSPFEYYMTITNGMYYDENGDAMSDENPNGKWITAGLGKNFSLPLILKDGSESYQTLSDNIDWEKMKGDTRPYLVAWETVMDGRKPETEEEAKIYDLMKDKTEYLKKFGTKDSYVEYCTSFWCYAVVDENGWVDMGDSQNASTWIKDFTERFGKTLQTGQLVSIYECTINDDSQISDID